MATNDYKPVANGVGANVETQEQYVADLAPGGALEDGYESGVVPSNRMNKTLRQSSVMTAAIAELIAEMSQQDVLDDGDVTALVGKLKSILPTTVRSIDELRALAAPTLPAGRTQLVNVLSYYAEGDGSGGGEFYWQGNSNEADNNGTVIMPDSAPATGRWKRSLSAADPYYAAWFGVKGDNTDDFEQLTDAIAGTPKGGRLLLAPTMHYSSDEVDVNRNISFEGSGWWNGENGAFGAGIWNGAGSYGGTILRSGVTAGVALKFGIPDSSPSGFRGKNLMVLGPGGVSTSTGVRGGTVNGEGLSEAIFSNIMIANFAVGFHGEFMNACEARSITIRGCSTGFQFTNDTNNCAFYRCEVQWATVDGVLFENSKANTMYDLLMQNCINKGVRNIDNAYGNTLINPWLENSGAITDVIDVVSGPSFKIFGGQINKGNIKFATAGCSIYNVYITGTAGIETTAGGVGFTSVNSRPQGSGTTTIAGAGATIINDNGISCGGPVAATAIEYTATSGTTAESHAEDDVEVSSTPTTIIVVPDRGGAFEGGFALVNGTKQSTSNVRFSEIVKFAVGLGVTVVPGTTQESSGGDAPLSRAYSMDGNNLRVAMGGADVYVISVLETSLKGD